MLLYSICYYYGKNKKTNIKNHLDAFSKIKKNGDLFILNTMIDSKEKCVHEEIKQTLYSFIASILDSSSFVILTSFNWGGTIVGLWMAYNYGKVNNLNAYIAHFEEDFGPGNNKWLIDSIKLLDNNTYQVGESNTGRIKRENDDGRITYRGYQNSVRLGNPEVWSDGGYYFSTIAKLKIVESKIGIFHKGDSLVRYNYIKDGIDLGEIGYPTLLYHANLKFKVLNRHDYFINEWWTKKEKDMFLLGLEQHGNDLEAIQLMIPTKSLLQITAHAKLFFDYKIEPEHFLKKYFP